MSEWFNPKFETKEAFEQAKAKAIIEIKDSVADTKKLFDEYVTEYREGRLKVCNGCALIHTFDGMTSPILRASVEAVIFIYGNEQEIIEYNPELETTFLEYIAHEIAAYERQLADEILSTKEVV